LSYKKGQNYYPDYVVSVDVELPPEEQAQIRTVFDVECRKCGRTIQVEGDQRILCCPLCGADLPPYGIIIIDLKRETPPKSAKQASAPLEESSLTLRQKIKKRAGI
jgi:tRNA(Ile2) C34 agmatinyltransferase TiaS